MNGWTRVGTVDDIPYLEGRSVWLDDRRVAIFNLGQGRFTATDASCPHAGGPLADGIVADRCVTCPLHGRRYDLVTGADLGGGPGLRTYEVREHDGRLWLRVGELAQAA